MYEAVYVVCTQTINVILLHVNVFVFLFFLIAEIGSNCNILIKGSVGL